MFGNTSAKWQTWAQNPKHEILNPKQIQNQKVPHSLSSSIPVSKDFHGTVLNI
jgi:hypothetical protein